MGQASTAFQGSHQCLLDDKLRAKACPGLVAAVDHMETPGKRQGSGVGTFLRGRNMPISGSYSAQWWQILADSPTLRTNASSKIPYGLSAASSNSLPTAGWFLTLC